MCLIPRVVAEDLGLPLPLFIKWDDAEYGLRARGRGYRTATVPGIAIWHMSFLEKDDTSDWQAYFHYRNRFVAAALHGPDNPKALLIDTLKRTLRHLMLMEYSAVALQEMALRDFLAGPEALFPKLPVVLGEIRATRAEYDDGRPLDSATEVPPSDLDALAAQVFPEPPTSKVAIVKTLARSVVRNLRTPDPAHQDVPQRNVPSRQAQWFVLSQAGLGHGLHPGRPRRHLPPPRPRAVPGQAEDLGAAAGHGGPRVAGAAPPLPRGGPAADQPGGLEADLRELSAPVQLSMVALLRSECSKATMLHSPNPGCSAVGVQPVQPRPVLPAGQRAHLRAVLRRDLGPSVASRASDRAPRLASASARARSRVRTRMPCSDMSVTTARRNVDTCHQCASPAATKPVRCTARSVRW